MMVNNKFLLILALLCLGIVSQAHARATIDFPVVKLRSLDKTTARAMTFEANVGSTVKFGSVYIKVRSCRKAPEMEKPEAASFLQVWETSADEDLAGEEKAEWVFSGWMFASSPGLSSMDHPIYDVWVLDCLQKKGQRPEDMKSEEVREGEGEVSEDVAPSQPSITE